MHQPRPYGLLSVGAELTEDDAAAVELAARRLTNLKDVYGVPSMRMVRALPDGGYVITQDMGGTFRTITHKPKPESRPDLPEGVATLYVPMLFCGEAVRGIVGQGKGVEIRFTKTTIKRLAGYQDDKNAQVPSQKELQRFRIEYSSKHKEFEPQNMPPTVTYTQYAQLRPTWFSGAMSSVVQLVSGYGRQDFENLPEDDPIEQARVVIPDKVLVRIGIELGNMRLPGYTGLPNEEGKVQYDYKFNSTNGVVFSPGGSPWLVRISNAGVYAMPLPMVPATTTKAFREWATDMQDDEVIEALDRFGGLPSGESIPDSSTSLQAWIRAGVIQKIADTKDFYDHDFYSTTSGWAFSDSGKEAANTCIEYRSNGDVHCHAFMIAFQVSNLDGGGLLPESWKTGDSSKDFVISTYLSSLYDLMRDNDDKSRAIKYKLRRFSGAEILSRASVNNDPSSELRYWDALEVEPIAPASASLVRIGSGQIPHMGISEFKFPEPFLGGCVSLNTTPEKKPDNPLPKCDTIVYVYYEGDKMKTIRYFYDDREFTAEVESDFEECMTVGNWTETTTLSSSKIMGSLYTSDFDSRKAAADRTRIVNIKGVDLGYTEYPRFHPNAGTIYYKTLDVKRRRYFGRTTNTQEISGYGISVFCCVPYFNRCASVYGSAEYFDRKTEVESARRHPVSDPNEYKAWVTGGYPYSAAENGAESWMNYPPTPKGVHLLIVEKHNYVANTEAGRGCNSWADNGEWLQAPGDLTSIFFNDYLWTELDDDDALHHIMIKTPRRPPFRAYTERKPDKRQDSKYETSMDILNAPVKMSDREISYMYFSRLPDENMNTLWVDGIKNCLGLASYASIDAVGGRKVIGKSIMASNKLSHHFIGVINE